MSRSLFGYVVTHDGGFSPNPDPPALTLACCKPVIRRMAQVGDWVLGTHSLTHGTGRICFAGQISEALDFSAYYRDPRFASKRPTSKNNGDNIYHLGPEGQWLQARNRHHDAGHVAHDTATDRVLVCKEYWYFGGMAPLLPDDLLDLTKRGPGHRRTRREDMIERFEEFIRNYPKGVQGKPMLQAEAASCEPQVQPTKKRC